MYINYSGPKEYLLTYLDLYAVSTLAPATLKCARSAVEAGGTPSWSAKIDFESLH